MSDRACPSCGTLNAPTAKFCPQCGAKLSLAAPAPAQDLPTQRTAQGSYPAQLKPSPRPLPPAPNAYDQPDADPRAARNRPSDPITSVGRYPAPPAPPARPGRYPAPDEPAPPPARAGRYPAPDEPAQAGAHQPHFDYAYGEPPTAPMPRRNFIPALAGLVALGLLGLLVAGFLILRNGDDPAPSGAAGDRPTPTRRPQATGAIRSPEPTDEPAQGQSQLIFRDDFSDTSGAWPEHESATGSYRYAQEAYQIEVKAPTKILWVSTHETYASIEASIDVTLREGDPEQVAFGLVLRESNQRTLYSFQIRAAGLFAFRKLQENGEWINMRDWLDTSAIKQGLNETNRLKVSVQGESFELYINDRLIDVVKDSSYPSGSVGFAASTFDEERAVVEFDNLSLRTP